MRNRAITASAGVPTEEISSDHIGGTAGWAPFGHGQHPSDQIGAYAGSPLNQFPANVPGVQLHEGVEFLSSAWYYPSISAIPNGSIQVSQHEANLPGAQRYGSQYSGAVGPTNVRLFRRRVAAASVQQTALLAQPWAGILAPGSD